MAGVDVLIVGAGVAGLSAARLLGLQGLRCHLLEAHLQYPSTVAGALGSGLHTARRLMTTWPG